MTKDPKYPYTEQGSRLRVLRIAERAPTGSAFATRLGWPQSGYSQFETGARQVPLAKVQAMHAKVPGFDAQWLWHGDKRNLGFDLRRRIEEVEASLGREPSSGSDPLAGAGAAEG